MFRPVGSKVNFPALEENILGLWRSQKVFARSVDARQGGPRFTLYEGPPTANGSPGIHHVLSRVFKDVIPRYKAMKGFYAPRIAGWDTHGLPVELEVEKELGLSSKKDIEDFGIDKFNARCRESVFKYLKEWNELTERIAFWVDLEHPYITMDNNYIESVWWGINEMWKKGLIYQGYKVTPHCPRCGTSLSSHEVALGYKDDTEDPSVYIKFKIVLSAIRNSEVRRRLFYLFSASGKPAYFLAWTTTPWTLPGNTALAVAPEAEYVIVELESEYLILAAARLEAVGLKEAKVIAKLKGAELQELSYEPLFNPHQFGITIKHMGESPSISFWEESGYILYPIIAGDFVSMEDGTGIVHIAPAYGEIDYQAGEANNLVFVHTVDLQGNIIGSYPFSGKFVKDADPLILDDLKSRGLLFRSEKIRHTYPFCWRCDTPLLYYAKQTWYIRTTAVKDELIARNDEINWYPEHIKYGRFGDWLQNNVDWAFSRERYWGTPLPIWRCENPECGSYDCVGGIEELKKKQKFSGLKEPLDLHRPFVDELTFSCAKCGGTMRRLPEVIDCWFDSGAMPIGQYHYPFDNAGLLEDGRFPADYISEAVDQTRGWFYSLHAISTLLFNRISFKNVICLGHVLDANGEKMSKAKGNVVEPKAIISKYGADALRWYFLTGTAPGNVRRFSEEAVAEVTRRFFLTLWNVYSFFVTYANIDKFVPGSKKVSVELSELDRWIISELNQLIIDVDGGLGAYEPTEAGRKIENFVDELSNWYVRRSRRRFWKSESDADKLAAYTTLYKCLTTLSKLLAPFTPFLAEELYQNLVRPVSPEVPESVHLADFPAADESRIDKQLIKEVRAVIELVSKARALRNEKGMKVRQPISKMVLDIKEEWIKKAISRFDSEIKEEVNIKEIEFTDDISKYDSKRYAFSTSGSSSTGIDTQLTPELEAEGIAREIVRHIQTMRRAAGFDIADHIITYYQGDDYIKGIMTDKTLAEYIKQETLSQKIIERVPEEGAFSERHKISGYNVLIGVKRLG
jgi:isoleucyl-tRNA synthetase